MATNPDQTIRDSRRAAMSILEGAKAKEGQRGPQNTVPQVDKTAVRRTKANPVDDFLKAGKRKEAADAFDLANRVRTMSDEDFEKAMADGSITPEQLRKAGEYDWDIYMGDVWGETDLPEQFDPEPTYDEFITDPEKYGYTRGANEELDRSFDRYKRTVKQQ